MYRRFLYPPSRRSETALAVGRATFYPLAMTDMTNADAGAPPRIRLLPKRHRRVKAGHPWIYSNEFERKPELNALPAGTLAVFENAGGEPLGTGFFNPKPLVAGRMLSPNPDLTADVDFFKDRIAKALSLRERLFADPFYRLIHAEADGLPGMIVDRYGDVVSTQFNAAGVAVRHDIAIEAIEAVLAPKGLLVRNDSAIRQVEGLDAAPDTVRGEIGQPLELLENGLVFLADLAGGQKTGWFYDQRVNRAAVAAVSGGARVLDVYCYLGGFGLNAAAGGAASVTFVDRSAAALGLAEAAAKRNGLAAKCAFERKEAFEALETAGKAGERYDVVVVDPPAFVKSRKDLSAGLRGYRKLVRLAARLVAPGGFLFVASCSHNVDDAAFTEQVRHGLVDANRNGRVLRSAGAGPDHPVHPFLAESAYLSSELLQLD